jgi:hypothetical protein
MMRRTLFFTAVLCLLLLKVATTHGAVFEYKKKKAEDDKDKSASAKAPKSQDWKIVVDSILMLMSGDKEFKHGLKEELGKVGGGLLDYCTFEVVTCNAEGEVESLQFTNVEGTVTFSAVPDTVRYLKFIKGNFNQPLDLSTLPRHVKGIAFEGSRFKATEGGKGTTLTLSKANAALQSVVCKDCGIQAVDETSLPPLLHLDLSDNPLVVPKELSVPTLQSLNVSGCSVTTPIAEWTAQLPSTLLSLDASRCKISGVFSEIAFPPHLEALNLAGNALTGSIKTDSLPSTLVRIDLSQNQLSGSVGDWKAFRELLELVLSHNQFTELLWDKLPPKLQILVVAHNKLSGPLGVIPPSLYELNLAHNQLSGKISLEQLPPNLATFDVQSNQLSGEVVFDRISPSARFIYLQNNKFSGKCDLTNLPVDLRRILVGGNNWHNPMPPR